MSKFICNVFDLKPGAAVVSTWKSILHLPLTFSVCSSWQSHFRLLAVSCSRLSSKSRREFDRREMPGKRKGCDADEEKNLTSVPYRPFWVRRSRGWTLAGCILQLAWSHSRCQSYSILLFQASVGLEIVRRVVKTSKPLLMVSLGNDLLMHLCLIICRKVRKKRDNIVLSHKVRCKCKV